MPSNGIITGYSLYCAGSEIQYYEDQIIPVSFNRSFTGPGESGVVGDLVPFTNYTCSISATTSAGEGERSGDTTQATAESGTYVCHTCLV